MAALTTLGFLSTGAGALNLITQSPAHAATPTLPSTGNLQFEDADGNMACDGVSAGDCTGTTPNYLDWGSSYVSSPSGAGFPNFLNEPDGDPGCTPGNDLIFTQGTKEDATAVTVTCSNSPPKVALTQAYAWHQTIGTDHYLYMAWEAPNQSGSNNNHIDFELNQVGQTFPYSSTNLIPNGGANWTLNRTPGDLLFDFDITPAAPIVCYSTWSATANSGAGGWVFPTGGTVDPSGNCSANEALLSNAQAAIYDGGSTGKSTFTDPLNGATIGGGAFGEMGIDLNASGLFTAGSCENIANMWVKSRSSGSGQPSELKSFIAPASLPISNCSLDTQLSTSSAEAGITHVTDQAVLSGGSPATGSKVTYNVYSGTGSGACTGTPVFTDTESTTAAQVTAGTLPASAAFTPSTAGHYEWQATYEQNGTTPSAVSACGTEPLSVVGPTLVLTKTADASSVSAGTPIGFHITLTNTGAGDATGVTLTDPLPGGNSGTPVTWSIDPASANAAAFTITGAPGSQTLTLVGQPVGLAAGASLAVHVTAPTTSTSCTTYNNTASATSSNDGSPTASASEQVLCPSVHVTKTADASSVSAGTPIGFTVTVSNTGAGNATGVTLRDPLPGGNAGHPVTWSIDPASANAAAFTITGAAGSQSLSLAGQPVSLAAGASLTVHVTAPTGATSCTTYNNTASVSATNDGSDQASASETVLCPSLVLTKTADASSVSAGSQIGFHITLTNTGAGNATGVTLTDPLPGGNGGAPVTWSIDPASTNAAAFTITGSPGSQTLVLVGQPVSLAAGASLAVHVVASTTSANCTTYNNTANATSTNDGSPSASASETVLCPSIHVTKTADASSVSAGSPIGFTVTVSNTGLGNATGVTLSDPLPGGNAGHPVTWQIDPASANAAAFTISGSAGSQSLSLNGQPITLAAGTSLTVHVVAATSATSCTTYNNTASASATNDGSDQASASESVLCPNLVLTKTADAATVSAGTQIGFTVTLTNTGTGNATGVTMSDPLPGGNAGHPVAWSIDAASANPSAFTISGSVGSQSLSLAGQPISLAAGASLSVHVVAATNSTSCAVYNNTANVTSTNDGSPTASASETVQCPNITVTKTADASSVSAGSPIGFTVTVGNTGPGTATGVTLSDPLPGGNGGAPVTWSIDPASANAASFAISGSAGSQSLSLAGQPITMAAGASLSVHVVAATSSTSCAVYNNTATASATNGNSANASASETVLCASIHVTKTADASSVSAGTSIGFTVTVSNTGGGTATGVTLTDPLPGGNAGHPVTWSIDPASANAAAFAITGAAGSQSLTLAGQPVSVAAGTSLTVHVVAATSSTSCTVYNNTASVSAGNDGSDQASASETVLCPVLSLTKTADASSVSAGSQIGFTVTLTNTGQGNATGVTLSDPLPGGNAATPVTWSIDPASANAAAFTISGSAGSQSLSLAGQPVGLAAGASLSVHVVAPTSSTSCAVYNNTANATSTNDGSPTASASETVLCPNIAVTKTADASSVSAGSPIGFTVTVANTGQGNATGVTLSDPLPGGNAATPVTWSIDPASANAAAFTISGSAGSQSLSLAGQPVSLASGASLSVHVVAATSSTSCATYDNTASASATNGNSDEASASESVLCADIHILKTADHATVTAPAAVGFTITVSNTGEGNAAGVAVTDALPSLTGLDWSIDSAATTPASPSTAPSCSISGSVGSQTLSCSEATLGAGDSFSLHITSATTAATAFADDGTHAAGVVFNTASVTTTNDGSDSSSAQTLVIAPVLSALKSANPVSGSTVPLGSTITYSITLSNTGTAAATGVTVTDAVPAGSSYVANSASCGGAPGCTASEANGTVTWSGITVAAQSGSTPGTLTVTFQVTVDTTDTNGQVITNVASFTNVNTAGCTTATCPTNKTTHTVVVPATAPTHQPPIPQVTTIHTGEPWAGSRPIEIALLAMGLLLLALGELERRRVLRRLARRHID